MARFGHTITPIAKDKAMLFGGAVGDTGNFYLNIEIIRKICHHRRYVHL
jgi:hypothetical protein